MSSLTPSVVQLKRAVAIAEQIKNLEAEMAQILGQAAPAQIVKRGRGRPSKAVEETAAPMKKRKKLSPEGLAAIVAAQKARWAKQKKAATSTTGEKPKK